MSKQLKFREVGKPATEHDIMEFERRWEMNLPPAFRQFCFTYNGGVPASENRFIRFLSDFKSFGQNTTR